MAENRHHGLSSRVFTYPYAFEYEKASAGIGRGYEKGARELANISGGIKDGEKVVEIGGGTGNSSIVLLESNPKLEQLIVVEPSDFIKLAAHKFERFPVEIPDDIDPTAADYIGEMTLRSKPYADKVTFVRARAEALPIADHTIDRVIACQSVHWWAHRDDGSIDPENTTLGFKEVGRILTPNGKFVFDSSGHQFDFEEMQYNGKPVSSLHFQRHPFHLAFIEDLNRVLTEQGVSPDALIDPLNIEPKIFTLGSIQEFLSSARLTLDRIEGDNPFKLEFTPNSPENLIASIKQGGKMRYFMHPKLQDLSDTEKTRLIETAFSRTEQRASELLQHPCMEIVIQFVASPIDRRLDNISY